MPLEPDTAIDRLAAALAAIDDLDEAAVRDAVIATDPIERTGAMAGILLTRVVDVLVAAAGGPADGDRHTSVKAHLAAAAGANQVTGDLAAGFVTTAANLLWSVVQYPTFRAAHGAELAESLADHFGAAVDHGLTHLHTDGEAAADGEPVVEHGTTDQAHPGEADGEDSEHPSVRRLGDACTALGITPFIAFDGPDVTDHYAVPVSALAGIITGRVALEYASALEDAPSILSGALGPMWARGMRAGVTTDPNEPAGDDVIAGVMMRQVMILGKWFAGEADSRRAPAVALLLDAAVSAARTDALESAEADALAEFIAHTGTDAADEHTSAVDKAGEAIAHLNRC